MLESELHEARKRIAVLELERDRARAGEKTRANLSWQLGMAEAASLYRYQRKAARTMQKGERSTVQALAYACQLAAEAGEVAACLEKGLVRGRPEKLAGLADELGDVLWEVAALATLHGLELTSIARANIEKLEARHPEGFAP